MCDTKIRKYLIEICTVVIALCALFLSIWQGYTTRQHNKLSVTPRLAIWVLEDEIANKLLIRLENNGVGPAIINSIEIIIDDEIIIEIDDTNFEASESKILDLLGVDEKNRDYVFVNCIGKNFYIRAGMDHKFFEVDPNIGKHAYNKLRRKLLDISIRIKYSSLYKEKYENYVDIDEFYRL